jgi:hypothetical protein
MRIPSLLAIALLVASTGCLSPDPTGDTGSDQDGLLVAGGPVVLPDPAQPWYAAIKPSDTSLPGTYGPIGLGDDNGAYRPDRPHQVYRPRVRCGSLPCLGTKLVVALPGNNAAPSGLKNFLGFARDHGFHAIGLDIPNPENLTSLCDTDPDPLACFGRLRYTVTFDGGPETQIGINGHPQDKIIKRLKALLLHLEQVDPYGGWDRYLDPDPTAPDGLRPHYASIVFVGHSLASGYAAYIGKKFPVSRVLLFSGMVDGLDGPIPISASWVPSHQTPSSSYYGMIHQDDEPSRRARTVNNWHTLGIPFWQQLIPGDTCVAPCSPHNSVIKDADTYGPAWEWMLGTP